MRDATASTAGRRARERAREAAAAARAGDWPTAVSLLGGLDPLTPEARTLRRELKELRPELDPHAPPPGLPEDPVRIVGTTLRELRAPDVLAPLLAHMAAFVGFSHLAAFAPSQMLGGIFDLVATLVTLVILAIYLRWTLALGIAGVGRAWLRPAHGPSFQLEDAGIGPSDAVRGALALLLLAGPTFVAVLAAVHGDGGPAGRAVPPLSAGWFLLLAAAPLGTVAGLAVLAGALPDVPAGTATELTARERRATLLAALSVPALLALPLAACGLLGSGLVAAAAAFLPAWQFACTAAGRLARRARLRLDAARRAAAGTAAAGPEPRQPVGAAGSAALSRRGPSRGP